MILVSIIVDFNKQNVNKIKEINSCHIILHNVCILE